MLLTHRLRKGADGLVLIIDSNKQELNLATWATTQGWSGAGKVTVVINSDVYIWSDNTATPALTTGSFPDGLTIVNNGFIMGKGGNGGAYETNTSYPATAGGPAISLGCDVLITGTGYIGGGGGGGGAGQGQSGGYTYNVGTGGGGSGGGHTLDNSNAPNASVPPGGPGSTGNAGATGVTATAGAQGGWVTE